MEVLEDCYGIAGQRTKAGLGGETAEHCEKGCDKVAAYGTKVVMTSRQTGQEDEAATVTQHTEQK